MIPEHNYHGGGETFTVNYDDRVEHLSTIGKTSGKVIVLGFNHHRCWSSALNLAIAQKP